MVSTKEVFRVSTPTMCICLLLLTPSSTKASPKYLLSVPNILRFDVEESVIITIFKATEPVQLELCLQDYPFMKWRTDPVKQLIQPGVPTELKIMAPSNNPYTRLFKEHFVLLKAKGASSELQFEQEVEILVTPQNGLVFIQLDKPIYAPSQQVQVQIIQVDHVMKPRDAPVRIHFVDPIGKVHKPRRADMSTPNGLDSTSWEIPAFSYLGNWSITAQYGKNYALEESVQFEVKDYVLPTFSVTVIVKTSNPRKYVTVDVEARYVFEKEVNGPVDVRLGKQTDNGLTIIDRKTGNMTNGRFKTNFSTPKLEEGTKLYALATVRDHGSGIKQTGKSSYIKILSAPYIVTFSRTHPYFKPGLSFTVEIDVTNVTGKPEQIDFSVTTIFFRPNGDALMPSLTSNVSTNKEGHASVIVDSISSAFMASIQVSTLTEVPVTEKYTMTSAFSPSNRFLQATVKSDRPVSVGSNAVIEITATKASDVSTLVYMVTSGGQTIHTAVVKEPTFPLNLSIPVVASMWPYARILVYYLHGDEVVADTKRFDVLRRCEPKVTVNPMTEEQHSTMYKPGDFVNVTVEADPRTKVAILAVDQAVYLKNPKFRMTAANVLNSMKIFDNGYGIGGGLSSEDVLQSMGLTVLTNTRVQSLSRTTFRSFMNRNGQRSRRHRRRTTSRSLSGLGRRVGRDSKRSYMPEQMPQDIGEIQRRQEFDEIWMYKVIDTGSHGRNSFRLTVPHSITAWDVQVFGINQDSGFCVAETTTIKVYKKIFVETSLPHSIIEQEQVEVKATIFNFEEDDLPVDVYAKVGSDVLAKFESRKECKVFQGTIKRQKSVTVTFPIVPRREGIHTVIVTATSSKNSDRILKKLNVTVRPASYKTTSCNFPANVTVEEFRIPRDIDKIPRFDNEDYMYTCHRDTGVLSVGHRELRSVRGRSSEGVSKLRVCTKFLTSREMEIDVGLFSGFEPITASLERLIRCNSITFVENYHITSRTIILQLSKVPRDRVVCLEFFIEQRYKIGKTQPVAINWEPQDRDSTSRCTDFYHPNNDSELLQPIISNSTTSCSYM